jgi:hypothetical protein
MGKAKRKELQVVAKQANSSNAKPRKAILTGLPLPPNKRIRVVLKKVNGQPIRALAYDYGNWLSHKVILRTRQSEILRHYSAGKTPEEIAVMYQMRLNQVTRDINVAIDRMIKEYATPSPEVTFVRYAAFQLGIVSKLQDAVEDFKADPKATQYNALVTALKAESDIYDKVLDKGQDLNVITKKAAKGSIRATSIDLRATIKRELITLEKLSREIDDDTQFTALRQGEESPTPYNPIANLKGMTGPSSNKSPSKSDLQSKITYVAKIRKVERNAFGIVKSIQDWKYRDKKVFDSTGKYIKKADITIQQKESVITSEEDKGLALRKKFYESRGIAYVETTDGKLIPFDPTRDTTP